MTPDHPDTLTSPGSPAPESLPDSTDALTHLLPAAFRHPVFQLTLGAGLDTASAMIIAITLAGAWAGHRLRIRTTGDIDIPCTNSLVLGLPPGVSPERADIALFDEISRQEAEMVRSLKNRYPRASLEPRVLRSGRLSPSRARTFLHNADARTIEAVSRCSYADELLLGLTEDSWIGLVVRRTSSAISWYHSAVISGGFSRRSRLLDSRQYRTHDNPAALELRTTVVGVAAADNVRRLVRSSNICVRGHLHSALRFIAEPSAPAPQQGFRRADELAGWRELLARATEIRNGGERTCIPGADTAGAFATWRSDVEAELREMPSDDSFGLDVLVDLPARLYGCLQLAWSENPVGLSTSPELALKLASWARARTVALHQRVAADNAHNARETHIRRLLQKIVERPSISRRDLMRTERVQKWSAHTDAVHQLLRRHHIVYDSRGRITATPAGRTEIGIPTP